MKDRQPVSLSESEASRIEKEKFLPIGQLAETEGKDWAWVVRHIAPFKDQLQVGDGDIAISDIQVPRNVYILIPFVKETDIPAGDWLTSTELTNELGVDYRWIYRRLLFISPPVEYRIYQTIHRAGLHYSPEVLDELKRIRDKAAVKLDPENYLSLRRMAALLDRHPLWVTNRLDRLDVESVIGLDSVGKAISFYPNAVLNKLVEEASKNKEVEGDLTIPMLANTVGKDREWVIKKLTELEIVGDYKRFSKSGRVDLCYPAEVSIVLRDFAREYHLPKEGWYTKNALAELTGKSYGWVSRRLGMLGVIPTIKQDSQGVLRYHYPPEIVDHLSDMSEGWNVSSAMKSQDVDHRFEDKVGKFKQIYQAKHGTVSPNTLKKMGVKGSEIQDWMDMGLITRWASGQLAFTVKAQRVVQNIQKAEKSASILEGLREWLD